MLSGKQISISVLEGESKRERERRRGTLSGIAELSDLKSNKKSCKGSLRTTRNSLLRSSSLARESAAPAGKGQRARRGGEGGVHASDGKRNEN